MRKLFAVLAVALAACSIEVTDNKPTGLSLPGMVGAVLPCKVAHFRVVDLGSVLVGVEGVMETWTPKEWLYFQLFDDEQWLGNGMTVIGPDGGFSGVVMDVPRPATPKLKYRCGPFGGPR